MSVQWVMSTRSSCSEPQENRHMKAFRQFVTAALIVPASLAIASCSSSATDDQQDPSVLDPGVAVAAQEEGTGVHVNTITEAPTGFDNLTNGFNPNNLPASQLQGAMDAARDVFEEVEGLAQGIGPVFNNVSCVSCHQNPFGQVGTGSELTELRAGHFNGVNFVDHPGGSLINDRANDRSIQEHILSG